MHDPTDINIDGYTSVSIAAVSGSTGELHSSEL